MSSLKELLHRRNGGEEPLFNSSSQDWHQDFVVEVHHHLGVAGGVLFWDGDIKDSYAPGPLVLLHIIQLLPQVQDFLVL